MNLEKSAPKLKTHWLHASGGLIWHLRALRYRNTLWKSFRQTVASWLQTWQPPTDKLLLVGPSAGYTLNAEFLKRWRQVVVLEPDPLARMLLRRRFKTINFRFADRDVLSDDKAASPLAVQFPGHAVLFVNVLGQMTPRAEVESKCWMHDLREKLNGLYWASYHDVISTIRPPDTSHAPWAARDTTLDQALSHFWQGGQLEIVDHCCFGLGDGQPVDRRYCVWPLQADQYHLVEWLSNEPSHP